MSFSCSVKFGNDNQFKLKEKIFDLVYDKGNSVLGHRDIRDDVKNGKKVVFSFFPSFEDHCFCWPYFARVGIDKEFFDLVKNNRVISVRSESFSANSKTIFFNTDEFKNYRQSCRDKHIQSDLDKYCLNAAEEAIGDFEYSDQNCELNYNIDVANGVDVLNVDIRYAAHPYESPDGDREKNGMQYTAIFTRKVKVLYY